jgi:hypothetical protein
LTAEQCESTVRAALDQAHAELPEVLSSPQEGGNAFSVLGVDLHVDQARRVITDASGTSQNWMLRDGKHTLTTARIDDRGMLSLFVGGNRFLPIEAVFFFLTDIAGGKALRNTSNFPTFLNAFVLEGMIHPERDLAIWVTAARLLETNRDVELHAVLPRLNTDFDLFHEELPSAEDPSHKLRPTNETRETWPTYKMRLLAEVLPDIPTSTAAVTSDEERDAFFRSQEDKLRSYVREQLFARVAQAVAAANGRYVLHSPFETEATK